MVAPLPADPLGGEVEVLTDSGYVPGDFRWTRTPRVRLFPDRLVPLVAVPEGMTGDAARRVLAAARADRQAAYYHVWSRYPYARIEADAGGWTVTFSDARYDGRLGGGGLAGLTVLVGTDELTP